MMASANPMTVKEKVIAAAVLVAGLLAAIAGTSDMLDLRDRRVARRVWEELRSSQTLTVRALVPRPGSGYRGLVLRDRTEIEWVANALRVTDCKAQDSDE